MGFNKAILIGNIGQDPVLEKTKSGVSVVKLGLATNKQYTKENGEKVKETQWHNVVMYKGQAETAAKYLKKGDQLCVEGEIRNSNYEAADGTKKFYSEIVVSNMTMLGGKPQAQNGEQQSSYASESSTKTSKPPVKQAPQARTATNSRPAPQEQHVDEPNPIGDTDDLPF